MFKLRVITTTFLLIFSVNLVLAVDIDEAIDLGNKLKLASNTTKDQVVADAKVYAGNKAAEASKSLLERYFPTVEASLNFGDPDDTVGGLLLVAPLSNQDDVKNTVFTQVSAYHFDRRTTVNLGIGYRRLELDNTLLWGVNAFYDHEFPYDHGRTSVGFEMRTSMAEFHANRYWAQTGWRDGRNNQEERALDGYDLEFGLPLPYMNWVKAYARLFRWDSEIDNIDDTKGNDFSLRADVPIIPGLALEVGHRHYSSSESDENFLKITYNIFGGAKNAAPMPLFTSTAYANTSMVDKRFEKVRRENIIYKQKKAGGSVIVRGF